MRPLSTRRLAKRCNPAQLSSQNLPFYNSLDMNFAKTPMMLVCLCSLLAASTSEVWAQPAPEDLALVAAFEEGRLDVAPENVIHVAPLPGDDGDGSRESPRRDIIAVVSEAEAGTAIHLAPGVYDMTAHRDAFGHTSSRLITRNDGEMGRPIVIRTDPDAFVPGSAIATLDFNYENTGDWSSSAFVAKNHFWVFERFEMRRMTRRGFSGWGFNNTYRELHLHHANTDGSDNDALIVMGPSGGNANVVFMNNYLHHVGNIDTATDELLDRGGVNGGCYYSVTRLSYDSATPEAGHDATRAEWEAGLEPPDGDVYVVGNHLHDCHYGLGLKNASRGPYFFLSNYIHDVDYGVFSPFRETLVRNNVVHDAASAGIQLGRAQSNGPLTTFLKMTGNGAHSEVAHNTVLASDVGINFYAGWNTTVHHNLIIDTDEPIRITRNQFPWWEEGSWPGVRGEYLIGALDASHPLWDFVPNYAHETPEEFQAMTLTDNCYTSEPTIQAADFTQSVGDITGQTFDQDYTVVTSEQRDGLFLDETNANFERLDDELNCGSRMGAVDDPTSPGFPDAGTGDDSGGSPDAGCGCRSGSGGGPAGTTIICLLLVCFAWQMRSRPRNKQ